MNYSGLAIKFYYHTPKSTNQNTIHYIQCSVNAILKYEYKCSMTSKTGYHDIICICLMTVRIGCHNIVCFCLITVRPDHHDNSLFLFNS